VHLGIGTGGLPDLLVLDSIGLVIPRQIKNIIMICVPVAILICPGSAFTCLA
jgi:hypothetical protein